LERLSSFEGEEVAGVAVAEGGGELAVDEELVGDDGWW
jgi:hypothetical protein